MNQRFQDSLFGEGTHIRCAPSLNGFKYSIARVKKEWDDHQLPKPTAIFPHWNIEPFIKKDIRTKMGKENRDAKYSLDCLSLLLGQSKSGIIL